MAAEFAMGSLYELQVLLYHLSLVSLAQLLSYEFVVGLAVGYVAALCYFFVHQDCDGLLLLVDGGFQTTAVEALQGRAVVHVFVVFQ